MCLCRCCLYVLVPIDAAGVLLLALFDGVVLCSVLCCAVFCLFVVVCTVGVGAGCWC